MALSPITPIIIPAKRNLPLEFDQNQDNKRARLENGSNKSAFQALNREQLHPDLSQSSISVTVEFAKAQLNLGNNYDKQNNPSKAMEHFIEAQKAAATPEVQEFAPDLFAKVQLGLGITYGKQNNPSKAMEHFIEAQKAAAIPEVQELAPDLPAKVQLSLGITYGEQNNPSKAIEHFIEAQKAATPEVQELAPDLLEKIQLGYGNSLIARAKEDLNNVPQNHGKFAIVQEVIKGL